MRNLESTFTNLNTVRAVSGLVVLYSHFFQLFILPVTHRGWFVNFSIGIAEHAVYTFFVLSGFLIAFSIDQNIKKNGFFQWESYTVSRVSRIYPPLIFSILLCLLLYLLISFTGHTNSIVHPSDLNTPSRTEFTLSLKEMVFTLFQTYAFAPGGYLSINGPLWSLSYEVGFYLYAGLIMAAYKGRNKGKPVAIFLFMALVFIAFYMGKIAFVQYGSMWMIGVVMYYFFRYGNYVAIRLWQPLTCLLLSIFYSLLTKFYIENSGSWKETYTMTLNLLGICLMITLAIYIKSKIFPFLSKLADSTYTLYIIHFPMMLMVYIYIRKLYDHQKNTYLTISILFSITLVFLAQIFSKYLEDKKRWEGGIQRIIGLVGKAK